MNALSPLPEDSILLLTYLDTPSARREFAFGSLQEVLDDLRETFAVPCATSDTTFIDVVRSSFRGREDIDLEVLVSGDNGRIPLPLEKAHEALRNNHAYLRLNQDLGRRAGRRVRVPLRP